MVRAALLIPLLWLSSAACALNDTVDSPLTKIPGDPNRGRAIVADRNKGLCLLCHSAPIPEVRQQGDLAPSLAGAGTRYASAQLRARIVDNRRINPQSIMPAYFRAEGLNRVGAQWKDKTLLTAQEIEDVVAYLGTLK
ncbi:MAG: sulfur oxidation c-type cytochrome SoxX [Betaproteobacteria bacterium]|nr:sulfur oxidation c-type cytochrome SoxX [Betaproteobacteria bacterium]